MLPTSLPPFLLPWAELKVSSSSGSRGQTPHIRKGRPKSTWCSQSFCSLRNSNSAFLPPRPRFQGDLGLKIPMSICAGHATEPELTFKVIFP